MYNLLRKTILSLLLLVSIVFVAKSQTEYLVTVNPVTGVFTKVDSIPGVVWLTANTTVDMNNHRFFLVGGPNTTSPYLITLDELTGSVISEVNFSQSVIKLMYSNVSNILYGIQVNSGIYSLIMIDPATGLYTSVATIPEIASMAGANCTLDDITNQISIIGLNTVTRAFYLFIVDASTGNIISETPVSSGINLPQYDNTTNELYGVSLTGYPSYQDYFGSLSTSRFSSIASLPSTLQGVIGLSPTFDVRNHLYYFEGVDASGTAYLYGINALNGSLVSSPSVPSSGDITKANLVMFQYDDSSNSMYALYWEPHTCHTVSTTTINASICQGTSYQLPSARIISNAGIYQDTVINSLGCDSIITALTLSFYPSSVKDTSINATICSGTSYQLPTGIFVNSTGVYRDTVRSLSGCDSIRTTVNLVVYSISTVTINKGICFGDTYQLPSGIFENSAGTYLDTVKNFLGCDSIRATVNLIVYSASSGNINATICRGTRYQLPSGTFVNGAGTYQDTIRNFLGCDSIRTTVNVSVYLGSATIATINPVICPGSSYQLPSGSFVNNVGTYIDTIRNSSGCDSLITTVNLAVYPVFIYNVTDSFNQGQSYSLPSGTIVNNPGTYQSVLKDKNGCDSTINTFLVERTMPDCVVSPPNAFTPNGDGYNDVWIIFQRGCVEQVKVDVYNRWGSLIYHSDNYNNDWNGEYQNKPLADATYYYVVSPVYADGRRPVLKGSVTILR